MYIEKIRIRNYRNFVDFSMDFHEGLNVIVGANNSGKTGLLQAINLLSPTSRKISVHDFNKVQLMRYKDLYKEVAPKIELDYVLTHAIKVENVSDESIQKMLPFLDSDETQSVSGAADTREEYVLHAKVGAVYSLGEKHMGAYKELIEADPSFDDYLLRLDRFVQEGYFEWNYKNNATNLPVDVSSAMDLLDIQYIGAERSYDGVRGEVRKEIDSFTERLEIKSRIDKLWVETAGQLKGILGESLSKMDDLFIGENNEIGLSNGKVAIATDIQMEGQSASNSYLVQARDTDAKFNLPLDHNGLGYNNLINIYMLIRLNEASHGAGSRVLCLEEPEAHLHPAMQYKLFRYLKKREEDHALRQQIFVTTHSSNISAVAGLDNMFMMAYLRDGGTAKCVQQSLKKQFLDVEGETRKTTAKRHLTKFLDVTRSDILFADKIILVEGIAERLLLPMFMEQCDFPYEDHHVSIVEIGGKQFEYFVELFNGNAVEKRVLCITDCDFSWIDDAGSVSAFEKKEIYSSFAPNHVDKLKTSFPIANLKVCFQKQGGRTFEDELFMANCAHNETLTEMLKLVVPDTLLPKVDAFGVDVDKWLAARADLDARVRKSINHYFDAFEHRKDTVPAQKNFYAMLVFAEIFLHYASRQKGSAALRLLTEHHRPDAVKLEVPDYIREGLEWLKQ